MGDGKLIKIDLIQPAKDVVDGLVATVEENEPISRHDLGVEAR